MSSTQYLTDASVRHAVFLQRYSKGRAFDATTLLFNTAKEIRARLLQEPTNFQKSRLKAVLADIKDITDNGYGKITEQELLASNKHIKSEAKLSKKTLDKAATVDFVLPADAALIAAVNLSTMSVESTAKITINEALNHFGKQKSKQIAQIISDSVVLGDTTATISKRVAENISTLQKRQLNTLVRTIVNSTASMAKEEIYSANDDILDGYRFIATLDDKTSLICGSNDQKVFESGKGNPMPALHYNCRSTTIANIAPEYDVGSKISGERPARSADGIEQLNAKTTYQGWLKKQPKGFVDEALGSKRSKLFRNGELTIEKFLDPTGKTYTLKQLEDVHGVTIL